MSTESKTKKQAVGNWESVAPEVRPSAFKNPDGTLKPFYLTREFTSYDDDRFELVIVNSADPNGKVPLIKMHIKGKIAWLGDHPIAGGAQMVNFTADESYVVTPLHAGTADAFNKLASKGFNLWQPGVGQEIIKKEFLPFGLQEGQFFMEYDLIYVFNDMMFWGARNVDGRGFDSEANRPTNLQIPLKRRG